MDLKAACEWEKSSSPVSEREMAHRIFCKGGGLTAFLHVNPEGCPLDSDTQGSVWSLCSSFTKAWSPRIMSSGLCYTCEAAFPKSSSLWAKKGDILLQRPFCCVSGYCFQLLLSSTEGFWHYCM